jgi:hypothetical protein
MHAPPPTTEERMNQTEQAQPDIEIEIEDTSPPLVHRRHHRVGNLAAAIIIGIGGILTGYAVHASTPEPPADGSATTVAVRPPTAAPLPLVPNADTTAAGVYLGTYPRALIPPPATAAPACPSATVSE